MTPTSTSSSCRRGGRKGIPAKIIQKGLDFLPVTESTNQMLSEVNNQLITETGRGTPMGRLMREYWVPILRSSQIEPGGAPRRVTVLGDKYVAFRLRNGEVGVMDEACPHRGASLALARNEDRGLRCIYHGWKMAPSGGLLEAPTHPHDAPLHDIKTRAHPVREGQGMIWTWLGKGAAPVFRKLAFTDLPDSHVIAATAVVNCNWLHPLETLWDVFHAQILHNQTNRASSRGNAYFSNSGRRTDSGIQFDYPEMRAHSTEYGFAYANHDAAKTTNFHFIMPFIQHHAISPGATADKGLQISVPIDDDHALLWMIFYNRFAPLQSDGFAMQGLGSVPNLDNFLEELGERTPENRWGQDREAIDRDESFAGFGGKRSALISIFAEDLSVIESQGRVDRSIEYLSPADLALVKGRKTLVDAVRAYERGAPPLGRDLDLPDIEANFEASPAIA